MTVRIHRPIQVRSDNRNGRLQTFDGYYGSPLFFAYEIPFGVNQP
jgi:hypothetical protein